MFNELLERKVIAERVLDGRTALLAAVITNMAGRYVEDTVSAEDFMPQGPRKPQTPEDMLSIILAINSALGGEVVMVRG